LKGRAMEPESSVLGRILLLQSGLRAAPDVDRLAEMTVQGLAPLPGVRGLAFHLGTRTLAVAPPGFRQDAGEILTFPLRTAKAHYGELEVRFADPDDFHPYAPFVANTAHLVALHIENERYEAELQAANVQLAKLAQEREANLRQELLESEARFQDLFADSPVPILVEDFSEVKAALDDLRRAGVTDWAAHFNRHPETVAAMAGQVAILETNRASSGMLLEKGGTGSQKGLGPYFNEQSRAMFALELAALAEGQVAWHQEVMRVDARGTARWYDLNLAVQPGYEQDLSRVLVTFLDIHDRKLVEEELRASEARFRTLIDQSPVAVLVSRDGLIQYANSKLLALFGDDRSMLGNPISHYLALKSREAGPDRSRPGTQGLLLPEEFETEGLRDDGSRFPVQFTVAPVRVAEGVVNISFLTDLTNQRLREEQERALQEQVRQSQKMESLGRLAGGIAHDMNNVLGSIFAVAQILKPVCSKEPEDAECLAVLERAAQRGKDLVKGLVGFARKERMAKAPVDLNEMIRKEAALLEHTLLKKYQLVVALEEPLPLIQGEIGTLGSALMNLCVNAVDAMPDGGFLGIRTRRVDNASVQIIVEDTGHGMPPEVVERAMEPFYTTKPVGKGTGLGLSQVFNTAKDHGGSLQINSQGGKGTQVLLTLPVLEDGTMENVVGKEAAQLAPTLRILLVDDDELIRATVPLMLRVMGHRVEAVDGGRPALEYLSRQSPPDLVILDMNMPDLTGLEVLGLLRIRFPDLPVLISTGYLEADAERLLAADPHTRVINKPFAFEEIKENFNLIRRIREASAVQSQPSPGKTGLEAPVATVHASPLLSTPQPEGIALGPGETRSAKREGAIDILLIEDNTIDRLLIEGLLKKGSVPYNLNVIESPGELAEALADRGIDIVISGFRLKGWDGLEALRRVREFDPVLPFLLLSEQAGEELIWAATQAGANDFLVKERLNRLVPAIERAMREAQSQTMIRDLQAELQRFQKALQPIPAGKGHSPRSWNFWRKEPGSM